ncbi:hypothetical protein C8J57DRAFT_1269344 [Mycena rebaudengoi]|nr:hypothetical protein C8J57DRAFT_1269344 [Mycena rebaudengoi]
MPSSVPKAVLYYAKDSVWSRAALLALAEKGYGDDEVDRKLYLRISPKGTVPALVVPFKDSLAGDVESRYKAITDTKALIEFLDKSRSPLSRTNTTSTAPAPSLAPATVAFSAASSTTIDILHAAISPDTLMFINARDDAALKTLAETAVPILSGRKKALDANLANTEAQVSEKVKAFWREQHTETVELLGVLLDAEKSDGKMAFFAKAKAAWQTSVKDVVEKLNKNIIGPYVLGDQLSLADLHLCAFLQRLVVLAGGSAQDDGSTAVGRVESAIGDGFVLAKDFQVVDVRRKESAAVSRVAGFWDAMRERVSWNQVGDVL